jgi:hypothetical protein
MNSVRVESVSENEQDSGARGHPITPPQADKGDEMGFCTAINCMDGRVQLPVIEYLRKRFDVEYVDSITEPGPNRILARQSDSGLVESILDRIRISVERHKSVGIAVVGHYDCAGNPATREEQTRQTLDAMGAIRRKHPDVNVIGLWVDEQWEVTELSEDGR